MGIYHPIPSPILHLFRLTLQRPGKLWNAYSMGENVDDAFKRHLAGVINRKEIASDITFVDGDLANPHAHLHQ